MPAGQLQACLRIVDPGAAAAFENLPLRVIWPEAWGPGPGPPLMAEGLGAAPRRGRAGRCNWCAGAFAGFYAALGFAPVGSPYLEDDIPTLKTLRPQSQRFPREAP